MTVQPEPDGYTSGNGLYCPPMLRFLARAAAIVIVMAMSVGEDAWQYVTYRQRAWG